MKESTSTGRWIIYQRERFPILKHGLLVGITSACVLAFSAHARGDSLQWFWLAPATIVGVLAFFQLRVLDEFKDAQIDIQYRPERPVPRGLVSLTELRNLGIISALIQFMLILWLQPSVLPLLIACWVFMALMTTEFFAPQFLKERPLLYLLSHQPIVPLLQILASSWDWTTPGHQLSFSSFLWLVIISFGAGITLEIGRKLRAPEQERKGVDTYTANWGIPYALLAWLGGASLATFGAVMVGGHWRLLPLTALAICVWIARNFWQHSTVKGANMLENLSAVVVLASYVTLALGWWRG